MHGVRNGAGGRGGGGGRGRPCPVLRGARPRGGAGGWQVVVNIIVGIIVGLIFYRIDQHTDVTSMVPPLPFPAQTHSTAHRSRLHSEHAQHSERNSLPSMVPPPPLQPHTEVDDGTRVSLPNPPRPRQPPLRRDRRALAGARGRFGTTRGACSSSASTSSSGPRVRIASPPPPPQPVGDGDGPRNGPRRGTSR